MKVKVKVHFWFLKLVVVFSFLLIHNLYVCMYVYMKGWYVNIYGVPPKLRSHAAFETSNMSAET